MTLGDRVAVMRAGAAAAGRLRPRSSTTTPPNLFVAGFIGSPAMNFMPAQIEGDTVQAAVRRGARWPRRRASGSGASRAAGSVIAGIRPESFEDAALVGDARDRGSTFTREDRPRRVDGLGAVRPLHGRAATGVESQELAGAGRGLRRRARCRAPAGRGRSSRGWTRPARRSRGEESELWVDTDKLHFFDAEWKSSRPRLRRSTSGWAHPTR